MVSIKEGTENAIAFARETLGPERTSGIRLEEIESTRVIDGEAWLITLSMVPAADAALIEPVNVVSALFGPRKREYKTFTVLKGTGEVMSMKIRELVDA
ncbi:MAG: hypothetical protein M3Z32_01315 [Acidobacteriota bacterium]|nr:hypothetical protein [Acidobacteriota bacterium]